MLSRAPRKADPPEEKTWPDPRAADDFPTIRMCIEEFRRERAEALGVKDAGRPGQRGARRVSPLGLVTWGGGEKKKYQGVPPPLGSDDFLQVIAMGGIRLPSSRHRRYRPHPRRSLRAWNTATGQPPQDDA